MVSQLCPDIQTSYSAFRRTRRGSGCRVLRARPHAVKSCSILFIVINYLCPWRAQGFQPRLCSSLEASHRHSGRLFHPILTYPIPYFKAWGEPFQPAPHCSSQSRGPGTLLSPMGGSWPSCPSQPYLPPASRVLVLPQVLRKTYRCSKMENKALPHTRFSWGQDERANM